VENVYVLPGIPQIFRRKFDSVRDLLRCTPWSEKALFLLGDEGSIAPLLAEAVQRFPEVTIGSYPVIDNPEYRIKVTLQSRNPGQLCAAYASLVDELGDTVVRRDDASEKGEKEEGE
jgi:molybdopterin-biosynthesis enzyme MoeA-like protein